MTGVPYKQRRAQVLALKAEGLTYRQIGERLALSRTHVSHVASARTYEKGLRSARDAKRRRGGWCEDCGAETGYNGHGDAVSRLCNPCAAARTGAALRGTGPTQARVLAFIGDDERRFMEIVNACGITRGTGAQVMRRLLKFGLVERPRRGVYRNVAA